MSRRPVLDGRTDRVDVRCLPLQRARWEVAARRANRTLADWIRLALDDAEREQRPGRRPATGDTPPPRVESPEPRRRPAFTVGQRVRRVYVCHPFASDPEGNIAKVRVLSQGLIAEGVLPIAPHLYLPQLIDEATGREHALSLCLELLATCDEVRVFGDIVTEGMERELREAKRLGILAARVRAATLGTAR